MNYNRFLVAELVSFASGLGRILDFGAGNGRFAVALRERGLEVAAVEPDRVLRASIRARGVPAFAALEELGAERFDGVYCVNVLEHLPDDRAVLAALRARLAPGGRLLLYVPAFPVLFSANDARVGHLRRYRRRELLESLRAAGLAPESARYVDSIGFFAGLWYRGFGRRDGGLDPRAVRLYDRALFPLSRRLDRALGRYFGKNLLVRAALP